MSYNSPQFLQDRHGFPTALIKRAVTKTLRQNVQRSQKYQHSSRRIGGSVALVDVENLAERMRRISELTETLLSVQSENEQARMLAEHVGQEIAVARLQIRLFIAPQMGCVMRFAS